MGGPARAASPTRRQLLAVGLGAPLLGVAGCSVRVGQPAVPPTSPAPGPDELARDRTAGAALALAADALATAAARPDAAALLGAVADQHRAHAQALRPSSTASTTPTTSSTTSPPGTTSPPATLAVLAQRERAAARAAQAELADVTPGTARLLASVAACRTLNAARLEQWPAPPRSGR